jgi:small-conductance mechanosensitive channel
LRRLRAAPEEPAMVFDVSTALTWILFLALFPISFIWLRRAWRIVVRRDFSEVALKRGLSPEQPEKFAPFTAAINLVAGIVLVFVIVGVALGQMEYAVWSAIAGSTIWMKIFADFILGRHAHPFAFGKKANKA